MPILPMFPLGTVLLPGAALPLHVFEPRYRRLVHDCLAGEAEFGVVLIERGREVGGGDVRSGLGTVARITQLAEVEGGRFALLGVGTRRIRVLAWLDDDPYPRAEVEDWPDGIPLLPVDVRAAELRDRLAELGDLAAGLTGRQGEPLPELFEDPVLASYQLAALAPLGPADLQRVLAAPSVSSRLDLIDGMLDDIEAVIRFQMTPGPEDRDH